LKQVVQSLRQTATGHEEPQEWARRYGLPLSEGFCAFWRQDYAAAARHLYGARSIVNGFGGSHAQRDIIDLTLLESALRGGDRQLAQALANERYALKPESPMNCGFLARSQSGNFSGTDTRGG